MRHAFADSPTTTDPLIFVVTHDTKLVASNHLHTLYSLIDDILSTRRITTSCGIIRASDEPLYLIPDSTDTPGILTTLPLLPLLTPQATLTTLTPTNKLIQTYVAPEAHLVFLTDSSLIAWQAERSEQLMLLASTYRAVTIVDTNPHSTLTSSQGYNVISPSQLTDYLTNANFVSGSKHNRLRFFLVLLGI